MLIVPVVPTERLWTNPGQRIGRRLRTPVGLLVTMLFVGALAAVVPGPRVVAAGTATTTADLNLRDGPGTDFAVILVIPVGAAVGVVDGPQAGFYRVQYGGASGWASADYLNLSGGGVPSATATVSSALNLRAGPSTGDAILAVMPGGAEVDLTGESESGFLGVVYNGTTGWAASQFLENGGATGTGNATTTTALNLRAGPSSADTILEVIPVGADVTLTGSGSNGYVSVDFNGTSGWAASEYLQLGSGSAPEPGDSGTSATTASDLNLRAGPGTETDVLAVMPAGAAVVVTGDAQNGFFPVAYNGISGWAFADFVRVAGSAEPEGGAGLVFPFTGGTWTIIQGYNNGTHLNRSDFAQYAYALDWARQDGDTAGQPIYAPASGTVGFNDPGSGGLAIEMDNGYTIAMFHVTYDAGGLDYGAVVTQGQYLGYISYPGGAGYASVSHVDMTLWQGSAQVHTAAPFSGANAISGMAFPDTGGGNQHYGETVNP